MNKEIKNKTRKLTALIMLAITTLLCFSVFSACGEKAKYEAQVVFTVGSRYDSFEDTVSVVLTKEKNIETIDYGLDTDVIPVFAKYQIIKVQNEEKTIEKSFYLYPNGTTPPEIDIPFTPTEYPPNYKITDKDGNERYAGLYVDYPDKIWRANNLYGGGVWSVNSLILENVAGAHYLEFRLPAYGKDERTEEGGLNVDTFSLTINVAEDTRPNGMKIDVVPSSVDFPYTKILAEETGNYDWYIMEKSFNWNDLYEGKYLSGEKTSGYQVTSSRAIYKIDGHESNSCGDIYEYPPKGLYFVIGSLYDQLGRYKTVRYKFFVVVKENP